ncbi:uncharacterized protein LY89DRAFT_692520 [Mollisia scopiformis]|uniref:Uncharacterized protein n=1 Tax=Mollisia scopiformis TaxID=149040 RepID=A0A132B2C2_MOLSC|nr:uncharacterized protein LY89DRAFT_692520 [Mollisia scopiformis]KUJ06393.1 hypothetical protein LY89DRAFT_692520 [Mollisia scopiformis]
MGSSSSSPVSSRSASLNRGRLSSLTPDSDLKSISPIAPIMQLARRPGFSLSNSTQDSFQTSRPIATPTSSRRSTSTTPGPPLSPMSRIRLGISEDNKARRSNPSRAHRRPPIIESPEVEESTCHCPLGHKDFDTCSADPHSIYYKSPSPETPAMDKKSRATTTPRGSRKRKAISYLEEEAKYVCGCGGGHDDDLECEYASTLKKHVEITTS